MRMLALVSFIAPMLAGCNSSEKQMLEAVREQLKDPSSAQFSELEMKKTSDGSMNVLCGQVNAKNSFGGYVGARPFTAVKSNRGDDIAADISESANCAEALRIAETVVENRGKR